jgi:hypothetical protein
MFMLPLVISKNMLGGRRQNPFGSNSLTFSFLDNLMKNMPKVMTTYLGVVAVLIEAPAMKIEQRIRRYINKVADRVIIEIQKSENDIAQNVKCSIHCC